MAKQLQDLSVMNGGKFGWMSWWAISDVFEEGGFNSHEFNNLYGIQSIRGIKKPAFRAFELLEMYGSDVEYQGKLVADDNGYDEDSDVH